MARVLVVDDNPANRKLLQLFLQAAGHEVFLAEDGRQATELAAACLPDMIFMDIQMPVMDGFAAVQRLREVDSTRCIPTIAVTAMGMDSDMARIISAGFDGCLEKPYHRAELLATVEGMLK